MIAINHVYPYKQYRLAGAWHLDHYISDQRTQPGTVSHSIIQFKNNHSTHVQHWCNLAASNLPTAKATVTCIVRALGSTELKPQGGRPLDSLGNTLATQLNCGYYPEVLSKIRVTPPMHTLKKPERQAAIHGVYKADGLRWNLAEEGILIIDDVTTGGVTLEEILRCMRVEWPNARYYFFALAKTGYANVIQL